MDQSLANAAPALTILRDCTMLRETLTEAGGDAALLRAALLGRLKGVLKQARAASREALERDNNGIRCAADISAFQDELIRLIVAFAQEHIYPAQNPSQAERIAIVATGGYGRGLLAPHSDIDLLFLLPYKSTAWSESIAEFVLYLLWDLGFKVGHATRSVEQCVRAATGDMVIRTALLDARLILGDETLFATLQRRLADDVFAGTGREFVAAKLAERDTRHTRTGASRYRVEPNIKDGKGGLRDLHTLTWIAKYLNPGLDAQGFVTAGVFSPAEARTFRRAETFLWRVRCHLHFITGKAEEKLTFDLQPAMAEVLGYRTRGAMPAVERFMKHYFLVAKDVGDLTRILCADLELRQLKHVPRLELIMTSLGWRGRSKLAATSDFRIENGRLNVKTADVFRLDPVNLIRIFAVAERYKTSFHPQALRLIRASLRLIDDGIRQDREANRLFLDILTSPGNAGRILRRMNETGVLGRFVPAFGRVVSMMQFNMYHHYTVDEHLIRTVGILSDIERGEHGSENPLSTEAIRSVEGRRALYVAAFLHDIAKGGREDHSVAGARLARELGPRFGLTPSETETAAWLVEHHLVMSQYAQSRDLSDPVTIRNFAAIVQSRERLKLLVILTVADIRAVGPGVWTGWKGQLLRQLYYETEPLLAGGHTNTPRSAMTGAAQNKLRALLADWPQPEIEAFIARHKPAYWLRFEAERQAAHARLMRSAGGDARVFAAETATDAFAGLTEITLFTQDIPGLVAVIAGVCAASGGNIVGATLSTTRDGMALNIVQLARTFTDDAEETQRAERLVGTIRAILEGRREPSPPQVRRNAPRIEAFAVEPQIVIDNTLSDALTVIEVGGRDRPGLLHDLASAISRCGLDISSAHIATFGEKAVDVFYVTDAQHKLVAEPTIRRLREQLMETLSP